MSTNPLPGTSGTGRASVSQMGSSMSSSSAGEARSLANQRSGRENPPSPLIPNSPMVNVELIDPLECVQEFANISWVEKYNTRTFMCYIRRGDIQGVGEAHKQFPAGHAAAVDFLRKFTESNQAYGRYPTQLNPTYLMNRSSVGSFFRNLEERFGPNAMRDLSFQFYGRMVCKRTKLYICDLVFQGRRFSGQSFRSGNAAKYDVIRHAYVDLFGTELPLDRVYLSGNRECPFHGTPDERFDCLYHDAESNNQGRSPRVTHHLNFLFASPNSKEFDPAAFVGTPLEHLKIN